MCDGDVDLFFELFQELTRRPGAAGPLRPTAVEVDMDEIRMMEDAFDLVPSTQMDDINPDVADETLFRSVVGEERETTPLDPDTQQVSAQEVTFTQALTVCQNMAGGTAHSHSRTPFNSFEMDDQSDAQSVGDRSLDTQMLDVPFDPEGRRLEYLFGHDSGSIDQLLPIICPSGSAHDSEAMGGQLPTIDEE
ncbi:hypothetical protein MCOR25_009419 [Pyricularia grisea]|nr:hypothetical protein MCOR25_009419 [Pyricularia grisea]